MKQLTKLLCWLGFHKPDLENAKVIPCPFPNPSKEDFRYRYKETTCLRCKVKLLGTEL